MLSWRLGSGADLALLQQHLTQAVLAPDDAQHVGGAGDEERVSARRVVVVVLGQAGEPLAECGGCLEGLQPNDPNDIEQGCRELLGCEDVECAEGEFCVESDDADASSPVDLR